MPIDPPVFPIGPFLPVGEASGDQRRAWIAEVQQLPWLVRGSIDGLLESQLDTRYRNWTIRQIVHHIADSHVNSYVRFKWTLTEDKPTIKAYDEGLWSGLSESQTGSIAPSLLLLDGLHARWSQLLESMSEDQYERTFIHPETDDTVSLNSALQYYAWHGRHHSGQIQWLREHFVS